MSYIDDHVNNTTAVQYTECTAWFSILDRAQIEKKPTYQEVHGKLIICHRGELVVGLLELADYWGWKIQNVFYFLEQLQKMGEIKITKRGELTHIKINRYNRYEIGIGNL